ncbi:Uncharacterized protein F383_25527 [Gossypium arboreum]|uniref:Uncharacterized protein n=1 Tax=Gossypium arboreum TaxID=29729 RepID=A0A0B0NYX8_GOSAR|nr:Uncharacterized protein F383_25527 [Gossypium arboreum]
MIAKNQKDSITLFIRSGFNGEETPIYTNGLRFRRTKVNGAETSILVQRMGRAGPRASNALLKHVGSKGEAWR